MSLPGGSDALTFLSSSFFLRFFFFFDVDHFKVCIELFTIFLLFMFWFFVSEARGILAGDQTRTLCIEGEVLTTGLPEKPLLSSS